MTIVLILREIESKGNRSQYRLKYYTQKHLTISSPRTSSLCQVLAPYKEPPALYARFLDPTQSHQLSLQQRLAAESSYRASTSFFLLKRKVCTVGEVGATKTTMGNRWDYEDHPNWKWYHENHLGWKWYHGDIQFEPKPLNHEMPNETTRDTVTIFMPFYY